MEVSRPGKMTVTRYTEELLEHAWLLFLGRVLSYLARTLLDGTMPLPGIPFALETVFGRKKAFASWPSYS